MPGRAVCRASGVRRRPALNGDQRRLRLGSELVALMCLALGDADDVWFVEAVVAFGLRLSGLVDGDAHAADHLDMRRSLLVLQLPLDFALQTIGNQADPISRHVALSFSRWGSCACRPVPGCSAG